jgi:hypothetical protein
VVEPRSVIESVSVNSKSVPGRRQLRFASLSDVVFDAERLVAAPNAKTIGNWPLDQLLTHLAIGIDGSIDGISGKAPFVVRLVGPFIKARVFKNGLSPGFRLPKKLEAVAFPVGASPQEALEQLRGAVRRTENEKMTAVHSVFGKLSHDEWLQFHLRHAELHLSFAIP